MTELSSEQIHRLATLIEGIRTVMLTTVCDDGTLRSRPMAAHEAPFEGALWFLTKRDAPKVSEVQQEARVNVSYSDPLSSRYVSISGRTSVVVDPLRMQSLWTSAHKAWFPKGVSDPELALLRIEVDHAEYWDADCGAMISLVPSKCALSEQQHVRPTESQQVKINGLWATQDVECEELETQKSGS